MNFYPTENCEKWYQILFKQRTTVNVACLFHLTEKKNRSEEKNKIHQTLKSRLNKHTERNERNVNLKCGTFASLFSAQAMALIWSITLTFVITKKHLAKKHTHTECACAASLDCSNTTTSTKNITNKKCKTVWSMDAIN